MIFVVLSCENDKFIQKEVNLSRITVIVGCKDAKRVYSMHAWGDEYDKVMKQKTGKYGTVSKVYTFEEVANAIDTKQKLECFICGKKELGAKYQKNIKT